MREIRQQARYLDKGAHHGEKPISCAERKVQGQGHAAEVPVCQDPYTYAAEKGRRSGLMRCFMCAAGPVRIAKLPESASRHVPHHEQETPERKSEGEFMRPNEQDRRLREQERKEKAQTTPQQTRDEAKKASVSACTRTGPSGSGSDTPPPRSSAPHYAAGRTRRDPAESMTTSCRCRLRPRTQVPH